MRILETDFETAVNAYDQHMCRACDLELSADYHYAGLPLDVVYNGNRYQSRGLEIQGGSYTLTGADDMTIILDNVDRTLTAIIESEEIRGKPATVRQMCLTDYGKFVEQETMFTGNIDAVSAPPPGHKVYIRISAMHLWKKKIPRRMASPACQVKKFKDSICAYAGAETWCDRSWDRCLALSNQANHRGFRWIAWLMKNPDLWWGSVPKR